MPNPKNAAWIVADHLLTVTVYPNAAAPMTCIVKRPTAYACQPARLSWLLHAGC